MIKEIIADFNTLNGRWEPEKSKSILDIIECEIKNIDDIFITMDAKTYSSFKALNLISWSDDALNYVVLHCEDVPSYFKKRLNIIDYVVLDDNGKWFKIGKICKVDYGVDLFNDKSEIIIFSNREEKCKIILENFNF